MRSHKILFSFLLLFVFAGCKKEKPEIDTQYPTIDVTATEAFPKQCSILIRGHKMTFKIIVTDNMELGSVSVDIHHNFDQHTHSTEVDDCGLDNKKTPVNPLLLIRSIAIPSGNKTYTVILEVDIPTDVDPGDYHFMIRATDKEGWQTIKGLSIKIT